jgi:hypothetical protein
MQKQLESKPLLIRTPALTISKIALYVIFCRLLDLCATCGGCQIPSAVSIEKIAMTGMCRTVIALLPALLSVACSLQVTSSYHTDGEGLPVRVMLQDDRLPSVLMRVLWYGGSNVVVSATE